MDSIKVKSQKEYEVIFDLVINHSSAFLGYQNIVFIADSNTLSFAKGVIEKLNLKGSNMHLLEIKPGEKNKNLKTVEMLLLSLSNLEIKRDDLIVAVGGGIVCDIAGFVSSIYLRGIDHILVPTTLLAMVDAAIGGKCGVNLKSGKNLVGSFKQPAKVFCDANYIRSQSSDTLKDGISEIIKYAIIKDKDMFKKLYKDPILSSDYIDINGIIKRCAEIKADIVFEDEFDRNKRQLLNFGHTIGHAIEKLSNYKISHGRAIAIGAVVESEISIKAFCGDEKNHKKIQSIFRKHKIKTKCQFSSKDLMAYIKNDKKNIAGGINTIRLFDLGKAAIETIEINKFEKYLCEVLGE